MAEGKVLKHSLCSDISPEHPLAQHLSLMERIGFN